MDPDQLRQILKEELKPILEIQKQQGKILGEHGDKLDSITSELDHVHRLANATYDLVLATYESTKREIDEIKDYVGLPKQPYFGETEVR